MGGKKKSSYPIVETLKDERGGLHAREGEVQERTTGARVRRYHVSRHEERFRR